MWKYSLDRSEAIISINKNENGFLDCTFKNVSKPLEDLKEIFKKGYQSNTKSEGFGYGLYWLQLLISYYNREGTDNEITSNVLDIEHTQNKISDLEAEQIFVLRNIRYEA
jgi:translation elongation factor EF-1beta